MQSLRLLQFKLEAGKGEAAAYVDSSVDLRQRRSSRSGQFLPFDAPTWATGQCPWLKLTCRQQKRRRLVEPFIIKTCPRLFEMPTFHHG